ncbi:MAG: menaquinone biosynthesis protein [Thermodesulfovibrionales bacterium]|nr:menaquinone biosynthesis protein [Thermodesulfovibrionales bacterium]
MKLRIGKIPYANLFPIFYTLQNECDCSSYEFIEGVPSTVNKMLRDGEIDISPSSSIECLRNPSLYRIIDSHSISSKGPAGSVLLFTDKTISELDRATIAVSSQSETSVALLDIVLRKFFGVQCDLKVSEQPEKAGAEAFLLIGDDALKYRTQNSRLKTLTYDLGEIWNKNTGLPFVFALWIARRGIEEKEELLNRVVKDLNTAKDVALKNLADIAKHSAIRAFMPEEKITAYWDKIDYDFTEEHKKGLELFRKYLEDLWYL